MLKEVCKDLKERLISGDPLKLVDVVSGMVQTVTYKDVNRDGNPITKRMPVSYDTNIENCTGNIERDLVPDSSKKGLIYFEENGSLQVVRNMTGGRSMYKGSILLVCWMNRDNSIGQTYGKVTKAAFDEITNKLKGVIPSNNFLNLRVRPQRFRQDTAIFARYTYEETVLQYLRPPFEFFAIDLTVTFVSKCSSPVILNPKDC